VIIDKSFFSKDPSIVASELLGAVLHHTINNVTLSAKIIETESYYLKDKGSHASLGYTHKRRALFMEPGTIYMYYARGGDSFNISCLGDGNAVLFKSGLAYTQNEKAINIMMKNNPKVDGSTRQFEKLCRGQTLLCKALALKVQDYNASEIPSKTVYITKENDGINEENIQTTRLGIPTGRDENLMQRFILKRYARFVTKNPLTQRTIPPFHLYFTSSQIFIDKTAANH
jgi:DNA-3-methyladenine glycosylase